MCVMHFSRELETGNSFLQMSLQWADHDEHESFRVTPKRML